MNIEKITPQIAQLYLGRTCTTDIGDGVIDAVYANGRACIQLYDKIVFRKPNEIAPHLRHIQSLTEEEAKELIEMVNGGPVVYSGNLFDLMRAEYSIMDEIIGTPHIWLHMLSKGFDLFGLIDSGLAKDVNA